jgi:hypothetical protein
VDTVLALTVLTSLFLVLNWVSANAVGDLFVSLTLLIVFADHISGVIEKDKTLCNVV